MNNIAIIIVDNIVINIAVIDTELPEGFFDNSYPGSEIVYAIAENLDVGIGYRYDGSKFIPPAQPEPTPEEQQQYAINKYNNDMSEANSKIEILTDATDTDIMGEDIDPNDVILLKLWRAYRVKLTRVDLTNPVWPVKPE